MRRFLASVDRFSRLAIAAVICGAALSQCGAVAQSPGATAEERDARIKWWREARFGMFIHWGLYAIPGRGEWVQWNEQIPVGEYAKLAGQFKPTNFTPDSWTEVAKAAGMKYMVLTSRHHDG